MSLLIDNKRAVFGRSFLIVFGGMMLFVIGAFSDALSMFRIYENHMENGLLVLARFFLSRFHSCGSRNGYDARYSYMIFNVISSSIISSAKGY